MKYSLLIFRSHLQITKKVIMEFVDERVSFPRLEEDTLAYWASIDAFQTSLKRSEGKPEFSFYDGPPFATGLPHYGHILAGTIKDTVTRYAHQKGFHVTRRFGWDCHGLPIEFEIEKKLGIKTREEILKLGIPQYNKECRGIVMKFASEWEKTVTRLGRWIDFQNDYKTLDTPYMESVWNVFSEIHKKGFLYRGFKVMPYSTACTTPLSNFEANLAYKDTIDPAVVVSFPLEDEPGVSFVAWTTTPWTLPSNLALCVNPTLDSSKQKIGRLVTSLFYAKTGPPRYGRLLICSLLKLSTRGKIWRERDTSLCFRILRANQPTLSKSALTST